jgi:hypothetical protein
MATTTLSGRTAIPNKETLYEGVLKICSFLFFFNFIVLFSDAIGQATVHNLIKGVGWTAVLLYGVLSFSYVAAILYSSNSLIESIKTAVKENPASLLLLLMLPYLVTVIMRSSVRGTGLEVYCTVLISFGIFGFTKYMYSKSGETET